MRLICYSVILVSLFASCKTEPDDFGTDFHFDYYPLMIGKFWVYQVDSTIYDPTGDSLISYSTSFLKEVVQDTFTDLIGNTVYRIEQFKRSADSLPWKINKVIAASIAANQATRLEDNFRFIKLTFPLRKNNSWDGNAYFDSSSKVTVAGETLEMFKSWSYRVLGLEEPDTIDGKYFPEIANIQNADNENLIELRQVHEKYAKGIGLVYRELWILDTQCIENCIGFSWEEKAEKGFILKQTIIDYN